MSSVASASSSPMQVDSPPVSPPRQDSPPLKRLRISDSPSLESPPTTPSPLDLSDEVMKNRKRTRAFSFIGNESQSPNEEFHLQRTYQQKLFSLFRRASASLLLEIPIRPFRCIGSPVSLNSPSLAKARASIAHTQNSASLPPYIRAAIREGYVRCLIRGTYLVHNISDDEIAGIAMLRDGGFSDKTCQTIAEYTMSPIAIFKPSSEVRAAPDCQKKPSSVAWWAKDGIPYHNEGPNEMIYASLCNLDYWVIGATLSDTHFFQDGAKEGDLITKTGSLQAYVPNTKPFSQLSPELLSLVVDAIPVRIIHKLAHRDLSLVNADRTLGNLLFTETGFVPIDHALLLSAGFKSPCVLVWMLWKQALEPFDKESLEEIEKLNFVEDLAKIHATYPEYPAENIETMQIAYHLLKKAASAGLSPLAIGCFYTGSEGFSPMGVLYNKARQNGEEEPVKTAAIINQFLSITIPTLKSSYAALVVSSAEEAERSEVSINAVVKKKIEYGLLKAIYKFFSHTHS